MIGCSGIRRIERHRENVDVPIAIAYKNQRLAIGRKSWRRGHKPSARQPFRRFAFRQVLCVKVRISRALRAKDNPAPIGRKRGVVIDRRIVGDRFRCSSSRLEKIQLLVRGPKRRVDKSLVRQVVSNGVEYCARRCKGEDAAELARGVATHTRSVAGTLKTRKALGKPVTDKGVTRLCHATPVELKESAEECRCFIGDADDLVRRLAIEFEIQLGLGSTVVPVGKKFQLASPEAPLCERGASDGDADARRLAGCAVLDNSATLYCYAAPSAAGRVPKESLLTIDTSTCLLMHGTLPPQHSQ